MSAIGGLGVFAFYRGQFGLQHGTRRPILFTGITIGWFAIGRFKLDREWQPAPRPSYDFGEMEIADELDREALEREGRS